MVRFVDQTHLLEKRCLIDGNFYCKDVLDVHIREGQAVSLQEKQPTRTYKPICNTNRLLEFPMYTYALKDDDKSLIYTTDERCKLIGEISVQLPDDVDNSGWEVDVTMIYGGTQLHVVAKCSKTGKEYPAEIKF